jgi:hypothetical protein
MKISIRLFLFCFLMAGLCASITAFAACTSVTGNPTPGAGDMMYNKDYHVPQYCDGNTWMQMGQKKGVGGTGCTDPAVTSLLQAPRGVYNTPGNANGVWGDGTYIYVADNASGVEAYAFDGATFTLKGTYAAANTAAKVWGDGKYIYVADNAGGLLALTFSGTTFTLAGSTNPGPWTWAVWGDGHYIYTGAGSTLNAYTFNGASFTYKGGLSTGGNVNGIWGDNHYIYAADDTNGILAYTFDGATFTPAGSHATAGSAYAMWSDGTYMYVAEATAFQGVEAYTFNGTTFTYKTSSSTYCSGKDLWGAGGYIYFAHGCGVTALTFNGTSFTGIHTYNPTGGAFGFWGDGHYIYAAADTDGVLAFSAAPGAGKEGDVLYNADKHVPQFCDGASWIPMAEGYPTSGLVGYWKLDDSSGTSAIDSSGDGNTGTLTGGATWGAGKVNGALSFDGTSGYMSVPNAASLSGMANLTITTWIKVSNTIISSGSIIGKRHSASPWTSYYFTIDTTNMRIFPNITNASSVNNVFTATSNGSLVFNQWAHVAMVYDGTQVCMYWNGVLSSCGALTGNVFASNNPLWFATDFGSNDSAIALDDVRIYNRALNGAEIARLAGVSTVTTACNSASALAGYWKFDDGTSGSTPGTAADSSGNGYTGILNGSDTAWTTSGKIGNGLVFNAANNDYVNVSVSSGPLLNPVNFTYSFWLKTTGLNNTYQTPLMGSGSDTSSGTQIQDEGPFGGAVTCRTNYSGGADDLTIPRSLVNDGNWHLLTCTLNGTTKVFYVDGAAVSSGGITSYNPNISNYYSLGSNWGSGSATMTFDDVRVYNQAISATDIALLYKTTAPSAEGDITYNKDAHAVQYCDGANWQQLGSRRIEAPSVGGGGTGTTSGLAGWWKLDDAGSGSSQTTALDSSGNGNNGTMVNSPVWTAKGMINDALNVVAASNQYVNVGDTASLQLWGSWTVSEWVNPSALPASGNFSSLVTKSASSFYTDYGIVIDNGSGYGTGSMSAGLGFAVYFQDTSGALYYAKYTTSISTGTWYLVTGVWDSSTSNLYLYVNGALAATQNEAGHAPDGNSGNALTLGQYFTGAVDDARVYGRALSASEVSDLYNAGSNGSDLALWWKLDDGCCSSTTPTTTIDSSGYGNTGAFANSPITWTGSGKIGNALAFSGSGGAFVNTAFAGLPYFGQAPFTASFWVKYNVLPSVGPPSGGMNLMSGSVNAAPWQDWSFWSGPDNKIEFQVLEADGVTEPGIESNNTVSAGQWYFVAATLDSSYNMKLYINGALQTATANSGSIYNGSAFIAISGNAAPTNGTYDDVRFYNRALSAIEIRDLYDSAGTTLANPSLTGWWKLDDAAGAVAADSSGGGNPGTLVNTPTWTTGMYDGALALNGTSQQVTLTPPASTFITQQAATISAWVQPTGATSSANPCFNMQGIVTGDNDAVLMNRGTWNGTGGWNGQDALWIGAYNGSGDSCLPIPYTANAWTHIAMVLTTDGWLTAYKNGVYAGDISLGTITSNINTQGLQFGYNPRAPLYLNGTLDDIRTYNRALSAADVLALYNTTGGESGDTSTGLVGWWKLDDGSGTSASDSSGSGNTGTLQNSPTWTFGKNNGALTLNGSNQEVDIPSLLGSPATVTVSAWANLTAVTGTAADLISFAGSQGSVDIRLDDVGTNTKVFYYAGGGSWTGEIDTSIAYAGTGWHLFTYVVNPAASIESFYVDGVLKGSAATSAPIVYSGGGTYTAIGSGSEGNFKGTIDDVRIYNRALSASDVLTLYNTTGGESATAPAIVQMSESNRFFGGNSNSYAFPSANTAGNMSVVLMHAQNTCPGLCSASQVGTATSVTDTNGNAYTLIPATYINKNGTDSTGRTWMEQIAYASNIAAGPNTVTVNWSYASSYSDIGLAELKNVSTLDQVSTGNGSSATPSAGTVTTNFANEVCLAQFGTQTANGNNGMAAGSGWQIRYNAGDWLENERQILTAAGSVTGNEDISFSGSTIWSATMGCFTGPAPISGLVGWWKFDESAAPTNGLVGWWKFDDASSGTTPATAADSSGNGNTGTNTGSPTWVAGHIGVGALSFNGTSQYVSVGNPTALQIVGNITLCAWVYPTANSKFILAKANGTIYDYGLYLNSSNFPGLYWENGGSAHNNNSTQALTLNQWSHICVAVSGTTSTFYINGVGYAADGPVTGGIINNGETFAIGQQGSGNNFYFTGTIDDARVYNRALSAAEIEQLYTYTGPTTAADSSGNGNTGTLTNGPVWTTSGKINNALTFNGATQYASVPDAASLDLASSWTVAGWVNPSALPTTGNRYKAVAKEDASVNANYAFGIDNADYCSSGLAWRANFGNSAGNNYGACYYTTINTGTWYHLAGTWDGTTMTLYLNGVAVATNVPGATPVSDGGGELSIGADIGNGIYFPGTIDDVRVYNRALTASEVWSLYNGGP